MKITYINHSGFFLETEDVAILIDYWNGDIPKTNKKLLVLSSHSHKDHFNKEIFNLSATRFILSNDIKRRKLPEEMKEKITFVKKGEKHLIEGIEFTICGSTDQGVSFYFTLENKTIYHSGDNNIWYWDSEDEFMKEAFLKNIKYFNQVDIAFIPVDYKLTNYEFLTIDSIYDNKKAKTIIPIHLWDRYELTDKAKEHFIKTNRNAEIITYKEKNVSFTL